MAKKKVDYGFLQTIKNKLNAEESRSLVVTGNVEDYFFFDDEVESNGEYLTLLQFLLANFNQPQHKGFIKMIYELNSPIRFFNEEDKELVKEAWMTCKSGMGKKQRQAEAKTNKGLRSEFELFATSFENHLTDARLQPAFALDFLRQLCEISRFVKDGKPVLKQHLIIFIEAADLVIPAGDPSRMSQGDMIKAGVCYDWFRSPEFMNGKDSVILLTESKSGLNPKIARLVQLLEVKVPLPNYSQRLEFVSWFNKSREKKDRPKFWGSEKDLAMYTAGLSIQAIMQLLKGYAHTKETLQPAAVISKIEEYLISQLGGGVVEFKRPTHTLEQVVGNARTKNFLRKIFIPRLTRGSISGATVGGAIGSGKTFNFEAVAAMLGIPVIVLMNIRSKWFGETDVIFERLRRILGAFHQVMIFVDEADTQFGKVSADAHATERRLTGKIQAMMADVKLKGKVIWLLLTARINLLSQDILRKGRCGDVVFAIQDPVGKDQEEFIEWSLQKVMSNPASGFVSNLCVLTHGYSAADYADLKDNFADECKDLEKDNLSKEEILRVIGYIVPPDVADFRRAQALHALLKISDTRLYPEEYDNMNELTKKQKVAQQRKAWREELTALEAKHGVAA